MSSFPSAPADRKRHMVTTRLVIVGAIVITLILFSQVLTPTLLPVGTRAPGFTLPGANLSKSPVRLDQFHGKTVLLSFFSTGCSPCLREIPILKSIAHRYKDDLVVLGIGVGGESVTQMNQFATHHDIPYPVVVDRQGTASAPYKVQTLPTLYLITPKGDIAVAHQGFWKREDLAAAVDSIVTDRRTQGD